MILEFDLGNSRGKWRLLSDGSIVGRGGVEGGRPSGLFDCSQVFAARAASVMSDEENRVVSDWVKSNCGCDLHFARSARQSSGVTNAYAEAGSLGIDRWAAVVAAFAEARRGFLLVDAGTALTLDVVDDNGIHQGGWILPGRLLTAKSLIESTRKVRLDIEPTTTLCPGRSTAEAVNRGAALFAIGAITEAIRQVPGVQLGYLSGGDAEWLAPMMPKIAEGWRIRNELVMDGLRYILPLDPRPAMMPDSPRRV